MTVRIRFSRGDGPAGVLVRAWTWSWCAHVGFKLPSGMVLDATPECGVAIRRAEDDGTTRYFAVDAPLPAVLARAATQLGRPYDWKGALGVGLHRDWQDPGRWFCSELVAWAFEQAGRPLLRAGQLSRITPRDLLLSPHLKEVP